MWNRLLAVAAAVALLALRSPEGFQLATAPYTFSFPRDHYAHDRYRTEWWYYTGHVQTADGRRFGYELTFFRIALQPRPYRAQSGSSRWHSTQLYPAHFAITDVQSGAFVYYETFARDALGQGSAAEDRLRVVANGWSLTGTSQAQPRMHLRAGSGRDALDLWAASQKPPAIHGNGGVSRKAACTGCASHYYSFTKLATQGTVTRGGVVYRVTGWSWMDHEFGSDELQPQQSGWDWFALQLTDGREIMLYRLRQRDGTTTPQSSGSIVSRDGGTTYVPLRAFRIDAVSSWRSPHTKAVYPSQWRVHVDGLGDVNIVPTVQDQELVNPSGTTYWEGDARVLSLDGKGIGDAYVELTGYAGAVQL